MIKKIRKNNIPLSRNSVGARSNSSITGCKNIPIKLANSPYSQQSAAFDIHNTSTKRIRTAKKSSKRANTSILNQSGGSFLSLNNSLSQSTLTRSLRNEQTQMEMELNSMLKSSQSNEKQQIFGKLFSNIISRNTKYENLLSKIKKAYDQMLVSAQTQEQAKQAETFLKDKKDKIQKLNILKFDNTAAKSEYKQFACENVELARVIDECESKMIELEDEIIAYSNHKNSEQVPQDDAVWNVLNEETDDYAYLCRNMDKDTKVYKSREKKLMRLIVAMRDRGFPVDEAIQNATRKGKSTSRRSQQGLGDSDTELEPLVQGPPKEMARPKAVPMLPISELEPEEGSCTAESDYTDFQSM